MQGVGVSWSTRFDDLGHLLCSEVWELPPSASPPAGLVSEGIRAMARGSYAWPLAADVVEHSISLSHSVIGFNINTKIY